MKRILIIWLLATTLGASIFWCGTLDRKPNPNSLTAGVFIQQGSRNRIEFKENGEAYFTWTSLEDALCGEGKLNCNFKYAITKDGSIALVTRSSWVAYYNLRLTADRQTLTWKTFDGNILVYQRVEDGKDIQ